VSNLIIYSFVSACGLALRFRPKVDVFTDTEARDTQPDTVNHQRMDWKNSGEVWVWTYTALSFISAMLV
jgi:hypothetical protein